MALRLVGILLAIHCAYAQEFNQLFRLSDGVTPAFFDGLMKSVLQVHKWSSKDHFEENHRRLQAVAQTTRRLTTSEVMMGTDGNDASGEGTEGVKAAALEGACSQPDGKGMSCMTKIPPTEACQIMQGLGEMTDAAEAEKCVCTDCANAGALLDEQMGFAMKMQSMSQKEMAAKGLDEVAALCKYKEPIECIFGGEKASCKSMVSSLEAKMPPEEGQPTPSQGVNEYMMPALKCMCDDCGYTAFAAAMKGPAAKLMEQQDMFPAMKEMATAFCTHSDKVKCLLSLEGNCKPKGVDTSMELSPGVKVNDVKNAAHNGIDCMCKECTDALGKILTITEKTQSGESYSEQDQIKDLCGLYSDAQCLLQQSGCQDAVKFMFMQVAAGDPSMPTNDFDGWAKDSLAQIKNMCEEKGVGVKEYAGGSNAGGDADGAVRMQGAPIVAAGVALMMTVM